MFNPRFSITPKMVSNIAKIQSSQTLVDILPLPLSALQQLQQESREQTVILSTRIEGNTLSEPEAKKAIYNASESHDEQEVYNLMKALEAIEQWEARKLPITEERIKELHGIIKVISHGRRQKYSEYRTEQNQVGLRNQSGFYLPPEPHEVPELMEDLVAWVNAPETMALIAPIKAGIFMYQFLTIHPYMDGNGRTARMFATYVMRQGGLGLKGLFVLEKYYARHLDRYYKSLQMGLHHNYYYGRNDADLTSWLEFFIDGVSDVFTETSTIVKEKSDQFTTVEPQLLRKLNAEQRLVFAHLALHQDTITTTELSTLLKVSDRTLRERIRLWIEDDFILPKDPHAQRIRSVVLSEAYMELADEVRTHIENYRYLIF